MTGTPCALTRLASDPRTQADVVAWLDRRIREVLANPGGWGGEPSLEPLVLCLIMLREEIRDPQQGTAKVRRAYRKHLSRHRAAVASEECDTLEALLAQLTEFSSSALGGK